MAVVRLSLGVPFSIARAAALLDFTKNYAVRRCVRPVLWRGANSIWLSKPGRRGATMLQSYPSTVLRAILRVDTATMMEQRCLQKR